MRSQSPSRTVIMISGYGRSGSTLLERLLGQIPGVVAAGEICHIWERGFVENQLCGCRQPFGSCEFWRTVRRRMEADGTHDFGALAALAGRLVRPGNSLRFLYPRLAGRGLRDDLGRYRAALAELYGAILATADARILIDSSKNPLHGFVAAGIADIDLRVIHLVRDSRGVAFSWMRRRQRPEIHWQPAEMPVFGPTRSSIVWNAKNVLSERLRRRVSAFTRIRYEDLVSDPRAVLDTALEGIGLENERSALGFLDGRQVRLGVDHTAAGNPLRFKTGQIELRSDHEWRTAMRAAHHLYVTALTWPLLWRYQYVSH